MKLRWKFQHIYWITAFSFIDGIIEFLFSLLELSLSYDRLFSSPQNSRFGVLICLRLLSPLVLFGLEILFIIWARKAIEKALFWTEVAIGTLQYLRCYALYQHTKWALGLESANHWSTLQATPLGIVVCITFIIGDNIWRLSWFLEYGKRHAFFKIGLTDRLGWVKLSTLIYISGAVPVLNLGQIVAILALRIILAPTILSVDFWHFNYPWIVLFFVVSISTILYLNACLGVYKKSVKRLMRFYNFHVFLTTPMFIFDSIASFPEMMDPTISISGGMHMKVIISAYVYIMYCEVFAYAAFLENGGSSHGDKVGVVRGLKSRKVDAIPAFLIQIVQSKPIGSGNFSFVFEGLLRKRKMFHSKNIKIALKVLCVKDIDVSAVLEELQTMSRISSGHLNVVQFHGVCIHTDDHDILPGKVSIVLELCEFGSLVKYLQKIKPDVASRRGQRNAKGVVRQLLQWAKDAAQGMEYLSSLNIIHGDLAARNVLLDSNLTAKISDFGMSRRLYEYQAYITHNNQVFPWRWMAAESLDTLKFSLESDIWSYGVLLWEIFSLGSEPYGGMEWRSNFVTKLMEGERLPEPPLLPCYLYDHLLLKCWSLDLSSRPKFSRIVAFLEASFLQHLDTLQAPGISVTT